MIKDLDKNDLSALKDQIELFHENPVWRHLQIYMQALYASVAEDALNAKSIEDVRYAAGVAFAVKMISDFENSVPILKRAKETV